MAVLAAAYLSHGADPHQLAEHLPEPVAEWLRLGVLTAVPTSAFSATENQQPKPIEAPAPNEPAAPTRRKVRGRAAPRTRGKRELVFPRQPGEMIMIGDRIVVQVSRILAENKARLRVDAPNDVPVFRYEVWQQRRDQRRRSVPREPLRSKPEKQRPSRPPQTGDTGGLFISRNPNETIMIGDEIAVRLIDISGQTTVRLGVEAPEHLPVNLFEVWQQQRDAGPSAEEQRP
jgi:carbon storage regulator CsrA